MKKTKFLAGLLAGAMLLSQLAVFPALADARRVVTLGANLSEEQKASILRFFGVEESEVEIITITNEDEREQLGDLIPLEQIGTRTYSCALVSPTTSGGIQVKTANMNYVTSNMIASTLSTSGVVNCDVLTAAPFEVSGTGALTGVMMAYETASGETLEEEKKELANEELVTTAEIAKTIGQDEATLVVNDIKIYIIRDEVKEQEEVSQVVDSVIETTELAAAQQAQAKGEEAPAVLGQEEHELLYSFGYKVAQMNYNYEDMKITLQRVSQNVTQSTGIDDPILDTFDSEGTDDTLAQDSILLNTDDTALGEDTQINATNQSAVEGAAEETEEAEETKKTEETAQSGEDVFPETAVGDSVSLTLTGQTQDTSFAYGTSYLLHQGEDGTYCLTDIAGTPLTGSLYTSGFDTDEGYIKVCAAGEGVNRNGLLYADAQSAVPCQYGLLKVLNNKWAAGYVLTAASADQYDVSGWSSGEYYLIERVDLYYLDNRTQTPAGSFTREQFLEAYAGGDYVNVTDRSTGVISTYDAAMTQVQTGLSSLYSFGDLVTDEYIVYRENGHQGVTDQEGNVLLAPDYQYVNRYVNGYVEVSDGVSCGLMDLNGTTLLPVQFEEIELNYYAPVNERSDTNYGVDYCANGYFAIVQDGKLGFAAQGGTITCEPKYDRDALDLYGAAALLTETDGSLHLIAADGAETTIDRAYESLRALEYGSGMLWKADPAEDDEYGCYQLLDWHGNTILPGVYETLTLSADGKYLLAQAEYGQAAAIYEVTYTEPEFTVQTAQETEAQTAADEYKEPHASGVALTERSSRSAADESLVYNTNLLRRQEENGSYCLTDLDGNALTEALYQRSFDLEEGYLLACESAGGYGVLTQQGEIVVPFIYDTIEIYNERWAGGIVLTQSDAENYDYKIWSSGAGDSYYLIDSVDFYDLNAQTQTPVGTLSREQFLDAWAEGDYLNIEDRSTGVVSTYDVSFTQVQTGLDSLYSFGDLRTQEYETFEENGREGLMDSEGNVVVAPDFQYISNVLGGYAKVYNGSAYGLADLEGHVILPAEYEEIQRNYYGQESTYNACGYYAVEQDGKLGYAVQGGVFTCAPEYSSSVLDNYGASALLNNTDGSQTLIAADGVKTELAQGVTVYALDHASGMLWEMYDEQNNHLLIDWHGQTLLDLNRSKADLTADGTKLLVFASDGTLTIYEVTYSGLDGQTTEEVADAAQTAPAAETTAAAQTEETETEGQETAQTQETETEGQEAAQTQESADAAGTLDQTTAETLDKATAKTLDQTADPEQKEGTEQEDVSEAAAAAKGLLTSAGTLLDADFAAGKASAAILIEQAAGSIRQEKPEAAAVLDSVLLLLEGENADADTITLLLDRAAELLG